MKKQQRTVFRIANLIYAQVRAQEATRIGNATAEQRRLNSALDRYAALCRQAAKAHARKWLAAAKRLLEQANTALEDLHYEIEARRRQRHDESLPLASPGDVVRDLEQMEAEFHQWQCDEGTATLSVRTDDIELSGVYLGAFTIQLNLRQLGQSDPQSAFSILAEDPNPAGGRDGVTHPHVKDERLCAGEALVPIGSALQTGRICDFFLLVRSVLQTYNAHSAYVPLDNWNGSPCQDCGHLMDDGEGFCCEYCENNLCDSCISYCRNCNNAGCLSCLETCPACEDRFCPNCMTTCSECKQSCCGGCLTDGLCPTCHEEKENNHESDEHGNESGAVPVTAPQHAA